MPTFDPYNWSIVPMPTSPAAPQTVEFTAMDSVAVSISPFTGQQQVQDWGSAWLEVSISLPPLTQTEAQDWIGFLLALRGQANVFKFGDPLATAPRGSAGGSPTVTGGPQTGFSITTGGWPHSAQNVLMRGDWVQINNYLHRMTAAANSDASGNATLSIWPNLREATGAGAGINVLNTQGYWRLKSNARKWSETQARFYGIQFEAREAFGVFGLTVSS